MDENHTDPSGRIINKFNNISCCVPLTSLYLKRKIKQANINVESRRFGVIMTPFSSQKE